MKKGQNLKWILGAMWLTLGSAMLAQPGWAQTTTPVEDKVVKTSIYFPMPHVSYNTLYLGKKLDIGISQSFRADLGSENCDGVSTLVGTGAELPSLWLPDQDPSGNAIDPTPLLLRNRLPNGTALQGSLDITGLAAPILVKEVEVGTRSHNGTAGAADYALQIPETSMTSTSISLPNLLLGNANSSTSDIPEFANLSVSGNSDIEKIYMGTSSYVAIGPSLPSDCTDSIHWEKVKFGGSTITALVCGPVIPDPFDTDHLYECPLNGKSLWCNVNSSGHLFCDPSSGDCPSVVYYWGRGDSGSARLDANDHKKYCQELEKQNGSNWDAAGYIISLVSSHVVLSPQCPQSVLDIAGQGTYTESSSPGGRCYVIKKEEIAPISCLEEDLNTIVNGAVPYVYYQRYSEEFTTCNDYCDSFN